MRILVVHNPAAGDGTYDRESLLALIRTHGHHADYVTADHWVEALTPAIDLVVAAGGDGTVADLARQLGGSGRPIGVLPLGTANNIAHALGVACTPIPEIIAGWAHATPRAFDAGRAVGAGEDARFVESVGVGLLSEGIAEITEGRAGYVDQLPAAGARMSAAVDVLKTVLRDLPTVHVDLALDGRRVSGDYLMVEVMNFGSAGAGLRLAPEAVSGDGLFDVVLAEERHRAHLLEDLPAYRTGDAPYPGLPTYQAREVVLSCRDCRIHLDDRVRDCDGALTLTIEPHAVTFLA